MENAQGVGKLWRLEVTHNRQSGNHLVQSNHEDVPQLVDFRVKENVSVSEGIFLDRTTK